MNIFWIRQNNATGMVVSDMFFGMQTGEGIVMLVIGNLHLGISKGVVFSRLWFPFITWIR